MFYCNDCANKKNWPKTVGNSLGICECCRKKAVCNCMQNSLLPEPKPQNNITDMYQGRREDLDPRVDKVLEEGPKIDKAMEDVEDALKEIYKLQGKTITSVNFHSGFHKHYTATLYHLSRNWDYTKEFEESLEKLNQSVLDAYITFLEAEREALIKRWNEMAKDLKPEKS